MSALYEVKNTSKQAVEPDIFPPTFNLDIYIHTCMHA